MKLQHFLVKLEAVVDQSKVNHVKTVKTHQSQTNVVESTLLTKHISLRQLETVTQ